MLKIEYEGIIMDFIEYYKHKGMQPNSKCFCNSGKKYKKCCWNNILNNDKTKEIDKCKD